MVKTLLNKLALYFGYIPKIQLNFAVSIAKRLDEHRELVEAITAHTNLLSEREWHIGHLSTQDDFLMRLYYLVHSEWPVDTCERVRKRPSILGVSYLPEFPRHLNEILIERTARYRPLSVTDINNESSECTKLIDHQEISHANP